MSLSDRVVAVKGRRCDGCGSEQPGKRFAFFWFEGDRAAVACYRCNKVANKLKRRQTLLFNRSELKILRNDRLKDPLDTEEINLNEEWFGDLGFSVVFNHDAGVLDRDPAPPDPSHYERPKPPPSPVGWELDPALSLREAIRDLIIRRITGEVVRALLEEAA